MQLKTGWLMTKSTRIGLYLCRAQTNYICIEQNYKIVVVNSSVVGINHVHWWLCVNKLHFKFSINKYLRVAIDSIKYIRGSIRNICNRTRPLPIQSDALIGQSTATSSSNDRRAGHTCAVWVTSSCSSFWISANGCRGCGVSQILNQIYLYHGSPIWFEYQSC